MGERGQWLRMTDVYRAVAKLGVKSQQPSVSAMRYYSRSNSRIQIRGYCRFFTRRLATTNIARQHSCYENFDPTGRPPYGRGHMVHLELLT